MHTQNNFVRGVPQSVECEKYPVLEAFELYYRKKWYVWKGQENVPDIMGEIEEEGGFSVVPEQNEHGSNMANGFSIYLKSITVNKRKGN